MKIFQVRGLHNTGKTFLIENLIQYYNSLQYSVAVHKHTSRDNLDLDQAGKDSWRLNAAGAHIIGVAYKHGFFYHTHIPPQWDQLLTFYDTDILILEGANSFTFLPAVLCLTDLSSLEIAKNNSNTTFAISGIISQTITLEQREEVRKHINVDVYDAVIDKERLAQLALKKAISSDEFLAIMLAYHLSK